MNDNSTLRFQFISEPQDINFGGKVHGGAVMKWIDQVAYTCASSWAGTYCVTVYVGGIRFLKPINIGDVVQLNAKVIYTGRTSIHIAVDVFGRSVSSDQFEKKTHCVIVFVSVDEQGNPIEVKKWSPITELDQKLEGYAIRLMELRKTISDEMKPYFDLEKPN